MNMQIVTGEKLGEVKARIQALQEIVRFNQDDKIGYERMQLANRFNAAMKNRMTPAEFVELFPNPPVSGTNLTLYNAVKTGADQLSPANESPEIAADFLELDNYFRNAAKPDRSLTEAEFSTLYPEPNFDIETAAIATAQTEADKLRSFLKSGPYPDYPRMYDIDFLTGTAVSP
ncbi:hypothetical protein QLH52_11970 [Methylomonas sp. OY6]|uniref:Uncharacterized protein n=1 Tax=Methylomonas defluvii TaxID=3045149 RepID=A0ABU4UEX9_9GAMM|nr:MULTISPECIES: hypothetical protein [unclassified Methylomonas]MDX8128002.1 hypothetical protein [Methylomonas sp. OY6]PKD39563.1 hypothetical protein CWO84_14770 [Methylomonas sp. Kb3]